MELSISSLLLVPYEENNKTSNSIESMNKKDENEEKEEKEVDNNSNNNEEKNEKYKKGLKIILKNIRIYQLLIIFLLIFFLELVLQLP